MISNTPSGLVQTDEEALLEQSQRAMDRLKLWVREMLWAVWKAYASDESRWLESQEKGLLKAEYLTEYVLRLWFEEVLDVSIFELDFEPLLIAENPGPALLPLRDLERFQFVKGDMALVWPNPETGNYDERAIDLAPECVRFFCEQYGKVIKSFKSAA